MTEYVNYRLALIHPQSRQLLAENSVGTCRLPQVSIPKRERYAEQLTRLIEERWKTQSVVLDLVTDGWTDSPCAIVEMRAFLKAPFLDGLTAVDPDQINNESLLDNEREIIQLILAGGDAGRGPFSRIGWIDEAQTWVHTVAREDGVTLTGETLQLGAGGAFCLIRLATSAGSGYWLKATGRPNEHEFYITTFLAKTSPEYVPRLIAAREDWNAWLMEEHGNSLIDSGSLADFQQAVCTIARLQTRFIGKSGALLDVCCGDHRDGTLHSRIDELIAYLDEAMALQMSTAVPRLSSSRLKAIGVALDNAFTLQQGLGIPDTIVHGDINLGSILYDGSRCVFTDWCEAKIGNPFLTFEQLRVRALRRSSQPELWAQTLRNAYKASWKDVLTERQVDLALRLAKLLSIFAVLYERGDWITSPIRYDPRRLAYSRSLARHLDRELQTHDLQEILCQ